MERYEGSTLRGRREERRGLRAPVCWVAIQRLQRVTQAPPPTPHCTRADLKAALSTLQACESRGTKEGFHKKPLWQEVVIDLTYSYRTGISSCRGASTVTQ